MSEAQTKSAEPPKGKAGIVSIAIMCSRVLGLARDVVLGSLFGAGKWMDCFMVAYRTPNMLRDLFAEGALSTAFITTFSQKLKAEGDESAWALARKMLTLVSIFMSGLTIVGILLAPWIVRLMALGWNGAREDQLEFTGLLAQIIYVFIALISVAALVMGILNAKGRFFIPAISSSFFNLFSITSGVAIGYWIDPTFGKDALIGLAVGVVIGGVAQLAVQLPWLFQLGFRFRPDFRWRDSGVKRVLTLMGPAVLAGSAVQAGVMLNTIFASFLDMDGAITSLQFAFRLVQLPIGIFGVAVATVTLPAAARAATSGINDEFREIIGRGVRLVMLLTVPSALGLALLAEPIIEVIWQRLAFTATDTANVASALRCYALGLIFYSALKVIQPTFYAIDRKWIPMFVSLGAIAINAGLNTLWVFVFEFGHEFLALSTTVSATLNFTILYLLMRRFAGHLHTAKLISTVLRILIAAGVLAGVVIGAQHWILNDWADHGLLIKISLLGATIAIAGASYFIVAKLLRVEELDEFLAMVKRRVRR